MMLSISKIGLLVFVGIVILSIYITSSYNNCSSGGFVDFCKAGPGFFLLPITMLGNKDPLWWDDGQQNWIVAVGLLYGLIGYILIFVIEKQLKKLDKR